MCDARIRADEAGGGVVESILNNPEHECVAHAVNMCELYYDSIRERGEREASLVVADLMAMGLVIRDDLRRPFWESVGRLKASRRVSVADCFAITLANQLGGTVLTADHHEFDTIVEQNLCQVTFIR